VVPRRRLGPWWLLLAAVSLPAGCALWRGPVSGTVATAGQHGDALALSDALEALIADGRDTSADRDYAWRTVRRHEEDTAAYGFACAAITGRLVQQRGLLGADLVPDVERFARRSRELDPAFRDGAATRLLGTLYVIAPAALLQHGDSEQGLQLLEDLTEAHPETMENHLRLAEAYISLGDPTPAVPHLCRCRDTKAALRLDDRHLLERLIAAAGPLHCPVTAPAP
jgi:hypothetical protein